MSVRVSVILPVYNGGRFLAEAIRSILSQRGVSFELLLADDGSTDESWQCVQRYRVDPRVRAWRFRRNRGIGASRNWLHRRARGKYLSIFDQDDVMFSGCLRRLSAALDRWPGVGVVYGRRLMMRESGPAQADWKYKPGTFLPWDLLRMQMPHPGTMVRKSILDQVGGYDEALPLAEDWDLFLRLAEVTPFRAVKGGPTYLYRDWSGSKTHRREPAGRTRKTLMGILRKTILRRYGIRVRW